MALAGTIWAVDRRARRSAAGRALFVLVLIALNYSGKLFDIVYAKGGFRDSAWVEFARWNAISRVEVDSQGKGKAIVIDADASTYLMNVDPKHWEGAWERNLMSAPPALANVLRPHGDYAIIGPGGGVDVLRAVGNGSPSVTGIEINPIIANTIMRGRYADYTFHLYERPEVHIHVTDGRSFVRNAKQQFDVVQMTLVDTWASTAAGAFALSENSLYTVEAFREYFEHLKPDGMIAITRWEFQQPREALRVVSVAMQALHEMGVANPAGNFIVVSEGHLDADGIPVVVLAKRTAFTAEELGVVQQHLATHARLFLLYPPSDPASTVAGAREEHYAASADSFTQLIQSNDPKYFAAHYPYDVSPVTDNAPFFFFTFEARTDPASEVADAEGWTGKSTWAWPCWGWCWPSRSWPCWCFWFFRWRGARGQQPRPVRLLYFIAVGLGYILVEIAFIQRFVLFLGHPVYALTVVVFLLLLSSGAGSMVSRLVAGGHQPGMAAPAADCRRPAALCRRAAQPAGTVGGLALHREAAGQCRAAGPVGLRHGHAVSHRSAGLGRRPCGCFARAAGRRRQRKPGGVGLGDERGLERSGLGLGDHHRHPVGIECHPGHRSGGLSGGTPVDDNVASGTQDGVNRRCGLL